jgi:hypothetical protein
MLYLLIDYSDDYYEGEKTSNITILEGPEGVDFDKLFLSSSAEITDLFDKNWIEYEQKALKMFPNCIWTIKSARLIWLLDNYAEFKIVEYKEVVL